MANQLVPPEIQEGYDEFSGNFFDLVDQAYTIDGLGEYYEGLMELDGEEYRVLHGRFADESEDDPTFRLVIERLGILPKDHRYWRVIVDAEGNTLVEKGNKSHLTDKSILDAAGEVLLKGDPKETN